MSPAHITLDISPDDLGAQVEAIQNRDGRLHITFYNGQELRIIATGPTATTQGLRDLAARLVSAANLYDAKILTRGEVLV